MRVLVACVSVSLGLGLVACGSKVPKHNGYKTKSPWKKAKPIALDDKLQGTAKGELDYADYKRAKWLYVDVPEDGDLNLALAFTPTDDAGDSTVAMEVLDPGWNVISEDEDAPLVAPEKEKSDDGEEEGEEDEDEDEEEDDDDSGSGGDTQKVRSLSKLTPGRYHVHLFLVGRTDSAEYELTVGFAPVKAAIDTGFPKDVAFAPALPIVPPEDDAPFEKEEPKKGKGKGKGKGKPKDKEPEPEPEPVSTGAVKALVISANASSSGGTDISINAGTDAGLAAGRKGSLAGVKNGSFTLSSCSARTCKATVKASIDEVNKSSMSVTIK
jgi:hypothetical protein